MTDAAAQNRQEATVPPVSRVDTPKVEVWSIVLVATPGNVPATCRIKKLLKCAAWYGLRCTAAIEVKPDADTNASPSGRY
ncbi:MAG TPA: hypothetical protein VH253_10935 [Phycisphaerae bacterium]|nr:hypothetical protein [Phycisphaerae bacterium]